MEVIFGKSVQQAHKHTHIHTLTHTHTQTPAILYPKIMGTFDGFKEPGLIFLPVSVLGHP